VTLTSSEAAEALKVEVCTLRQWIRRGKLHPVPGSRPHEFSAAEVYDLQVARRTPDDIAWHDALWAEYDRVLADQH
jgi:predicted site-specific integrase-resolvase